MNTTVVMSLSALFMAVLGLGASFLPQEILIHAGYRPQGPGRLLVQAAGALYLGQAMLNWMARANLMGGIYSRPVAVCNFTHFAVLAVVLVKALLAGQTGPEVLLGAGLYLACACAFACAFGFVLFTHPAQLARHAP